MMKVEGLSVTVPAPTGPRHIVEEVSFELEAGACLGIVGESGSGKTMSMLALVGLLPEGAASSGTALFEGVDLLALDDAALAAVRGGRIGFVFQEPMSAFNPVQRIGDQIAEPLVVHRGLSWTEARKQAVPLLASVKIDEPERIARAYPHELSGGQRQRALIAMMIAGSPSLLIADEATTALDASIQSEVLELLKALRREQGMALIFVSHDLGAVAEIADGIMVLYAGLIMETGNAATILKAPAHPYTRALMKARPRLEASPGERLAAIPGGPMLGGPPENACPFAPRCEYAIAECRQQRPELTSLKPGHLVRCIRAAELWGAT